MNHQTPNVNIPDQNWNAKWWAERPERLKKEEFAVDENFPQFTFGKHDGRMFCDGDLTTSSHKHDSFENTYHVVIAYPDNYPFDPPMPYVVNPDLEQYNPPHMYRDGELCVLEQSDETWKENSTAATMIGLIGAWLHAFEVWQATDDWPGQEAH